MKLSKQTITSATIILVLSNFISNGLGVVREMLLAYYYGTSRQYDIFVLSQYLPSMINAVFFYGIPSVFTPLYFQVWNSYGPDRAKAFEQHFLGTWSLIGLLMCIIGAIVSPYLVDFLFSHLSTQDKALLNWSMQVLILATFFSIVFMLLKAILSAHKHFLFPAASMLMLNVSVILILFLYGEKSGVEAIVYGISLGMFLQFITLVYVLKRVDISLSPRFSLNDSLIKNSLLTATSVVSIEILWGIFYYIDGYLASYLDQGNISILNYALVLFRIPNILFGISLGTAILPSLSSSYSNNKVEDAVDLFMRSVKILFLICLYIIGVYIIAGRDLIQLLYLRGSFTEKAVHDTSVFLMYIAPATFLIAVYPLLFRLMSAAKKNEVMAVIFISGIIFKFILFKYFLIRYDLVGLALSINFSLLVSFCLSLVYANSIMNLKFKNLVSFFSINLLLLISTIGSALFINKWICLVLLGVLVIYYNPVERKMIFKKIGIE